MGINKLFHRDMATVSRLKNRLNNIFLKAIVYKSINVNILNQLCIVLSSAWTALCASQKNGFIFIYQSYLLVTWVFVLCRLQTRSAPPPFLVVRQGPESPTKCSALSTYTSLRRKREILPPTPTEDQRWVTKTWLSLS